MMTQEAILYYADHPADFVEDLLHVTPDKTSAPYWILWQRTR